MLRCNERKVMSGSGGGRDWRPTRDGEQLIEFLIHLILPVLQFQLLCSEGEGVRM